MTQNASTPSGLQFLRPKARLLRTLGDELISSDTVAVLELVKNAYDADATHVEVRFHEPMLKGKGCIEVIDNGQGMSLETIQETWMEPATTFRKRCTKSERLNRRVLGEKGIGRFAASHLADYLDVVTRKAGTNYETCVRFDWTQFDDDEKYLDEVGISWEHTEPREICPNGTMGLLCDCAILEADQLNHGTIMRMKGLRKSWDRKQIESLRVGLSRLVSPFLKKDNFDREDCFQIFLRLPSQFEGLSGIVEPPEELEHPHYLLKGSVDSGGNYALTFKSKLEDEGEHIENRIIFDDERIPTCGPFDIELRVWDREPKDLKNLAEEFDSTIEQIRNLLNEAAGINIYRDGFRVLPYGDKGNDWLLLDSRRVNNPTMCLSNSQVVGYVLISADKNLLLRDQSNREGIIAGSALEDFRISILYVINVLENRRYKLRHPEEAGKKSVIDTEKHSIITKADEPSAKKMGLFSGFNLGSIQSFLKDKRSEDLELLKVIGEKERDLERRVEQVREVLSRYQRLAVLGQLVDIILHEGRAPLSKIGSEAYLGMKDIESNKSSNINICSQLNQRFQDIKAQTDILAKLFRKIEPFSGRKRGRPTQLRLEQIIANAFSVLDKEIALVGANVTLPETDTQVRVDQAEIQEVIVNLLQNSLYWLRKVPKEKRSILVSVNRIGPDEVEILFSDSGPGVNPEFKDEIFDPYFTEKPNGVGLGLTIAGEIINEYYDGSLELLDRGPLHGATFCIILRRRV